MFVCLRDVSMRVFFAVVGAVYLVNLMVFFATIERDYWSTFFWSTVNWADTLRDEIWNNAWHSSPDWGIASLDGDLDAHRARIVWNYRKEHVPWTNVISWLQTHESRFQETLPAWFTTDWLEKLPPDVVDQVWPEPGALLRLRDLLINRPQLPVTPV